MSVVLSILLLAVAAGTRDYEQRVVRDDQGVELWYWLRMPAGYDPGKKYPLFIWCHGGRGSGKDGKPGIVGGLDPREFEKHPCFIALPKCRREEKFSWPTVHHRTGSYAMDERPTDSIRLAIEMVERLLKEFPAVDADRVYITGASYGGYAVWELITRRPDLFAAAIPICGAGDPSRASSIAKMPVWAFHGDKDNLVPVSGSRDMVEALKKAGGSPKYTETPGGGHNVWDAAFRNPETLAWLFARKRGARP